MISFDRKILIKFDDNFFSVKIHTFREEKFHMLKSEFFKKQTKTQILICEKLRITKNTEF